MIRDNQRRILLLHRNKNGLVQWELPGGKIDEGENAVTTAVRETREELGIDVAVQRELGSAEFASAFIKYGELAESDTNRRSQTGLGRVSPALSVKAQYGYIL